MEQKGVDILCVQETRWKREKARCIGGGYKMWYCGSGNKKNGVGIIFKKEHVDRVVELWRVTNRVICFVGSQSNYALLCDSSLRDQL